MIVLEGGLDQRGRVALLSEVPGLVAGRLHGDGQVWAVGGREFGITILPAEVGTAAQEHVPAWGADGALVAAQAEGVREGEASIDERVEVRRLHDRMPQRADAVRTHVVREEEEDVGLL